MQNCSAENTLESGIQALGMPLGQTWWTSQSAFDDIKSLCSDRPLATGLICVSVLECSGRRFRLTKPICIQESYEQGIWSRRFDLLGILAYGQSKEEAMEAFCEEFACCWEQIACEQDDNLTVDAQDLKRRLRDLVKGGAELLE
ncbi:MAG: hypothetical protein NTZ17_14710 [Phycisphaerae bacterium]|nr:hypothetical protein [Phycisphaerae bacterium]